MADLFSFLQASLSSEKQMEDAVTWDKVEQVNELIKSGYNINCKLQQHGGNTALHLAAKMGHAVILQTLIQHGADPMLKNDFNFTPINLAARKNQPKCLEILLSHAKNLPDIDAMWLQFGGSMILWREATDEVIGTLICATPNFSSARSNIQNNLFYLLAHRRMFQSLKLLVQSGNPLTPHQVQKLQTSRETDFLNWLKEYNSNPGSLQHYCRISLRRAFESRVNVFYGAKCLPIPQFLQEFLCMKTELYTRDLPMEVEDDNNNAMQ